MRKQASHSGQRLLQQPQLKARLLLSWCAAWVIYIARAAQRLGPTEGDVLWLFWQPVLPPLLMLWLWGAAVRKFSQLTVDYENCFASKDKKYLLDGSEIQRIALILLTAVVTTAGCYCALAELRLYLLAEALPFILYCSLTVLVFLPVAVLHRPTRQFFATTALRVLLPMQEVSWADFLLADIFCSLSKSVADFSSALCHSATAPVMRGLVHKDYAASVMCHPTAPIMMLSPCLPYAIRFIQCLIVNRTTGSVPQLFNAAKYCSSFPALLLTCLEHQAHATGTGFPLRRLWLVSMIINTLYSFYWDVEHDWDMPWLLAAARKSRALGAAGELQAGGAAPQSHLGRRRVGGLLPSLRPDARYHPKSWYVWALMSNLVLRCTWTHRLMGNIENSRSVGLVLACAEVWRRYQWSFIRIETELRKIAARSASAMSLETLAPSSSLTGLMNQTHGMGAGASTQLAQLPSQSDSAYNRAVASAGGIPSAPLQDIPDKVGTIGPYLKLQTLFPVKTLNPGATTGVTTGASGLPSSSSASDTPNAGGIGGAGFGTVQHRTIGQSASFLNGAQFSHGGASV